MKSKYVSNGICERTLQAMVVLLSDGELCSASGDGSVIMWSVACGSSLQMAFVEYCRA
jgi:hypothetical protein